MNAREFIDLWNDSRDYIICQSSGSTGIPKQIELSKADMRRSALSTIEFFGLTVGANYVCPIPFDYIGGRMMAVRAIVGNGNLVEITPSNRFSLPTCYADLLAIVPSQIPAIVSVKNSAERIRNVIIGGAPVDDAMKEMIINSGISAWQTYGMTETASHVALSKVTREEPVYDALPGVSFETDDRSCLIINRPGCETHRIVTNDIVDLLSPSSFRWLGRHDNVINSGGIKIFPEQLEKEIFRNISELTDRCFIRKRIDQKWGEVPELVIESTISIDGLYERLKTILGSKVAPRHIVSVPELPRTANGKLKRY